MLTTISITLKADPAVSRIVRAAFPDYRKQKAYIKAFSTAGESINSYWDGGSRSEFAIVELATLRRKDLPTSTHPYFDIARHGLANVEDPYVTIDRAGNVRLKAIPQGFVLVEAGISCGKPATACLSFHLSDLPKQLSTGDPQ